MNDRTEPDAGQQTPDPPRNWRDLAACRSHPAELWFSDHPSDRHEAKRICREDCPVSAQCLSAEMKFEGGKMARGRHGIRGALDGDQRYALHVRNQRHARRARAAS